MPINPETGEPEEAQPPNEVSLVAAALLLALLQTTELLLSAPGSLCMVQAGTEPVELRPSLERSAEHVVGCHCQWQATMHMCTCQHWYC